MHQALRKISLPPKAHASWSLCLLVYQLCLISGLAVQLEHKGLEQGLAVVGKLYHAGEYIDVLVGLTGRATPLTIDLHNEQRWMNLLQYTLILDDLGAAHVGANLQALSHEIVEGVMYGADEVYLLLQIHVNYPPSRKCKNSVGKFNTLVNHRFSQFAQQHKVCKC